MSLVFSLFPFERGNRQPPRQGRGSLTFFSPPFSPSCPPPPPPPPFPGSPLSLSLPISVVIAALDAAKGAGAYKTILDCSERNVSFYERAGLARKEVQMVKYY